MIQVFDTEKRAAEFAEKKNKTARKFYYKVFEYPKSIGGNGKKVLVKKVKK